MILYIAGMFVTLAFNLLAIWGYFSGKYPLHERSQETLGRIKENVILMACMNAIWWPAGIIIVLIMSDFCEYGFQIPFKIAHQRTSP